MQTISFPSIIQKAHWSFEFLRVIADAINDLRMCQSIGFVVVTDVKHSRPSLTLYVSKGEK